MEQVIKRQLIETAAKDGKCYMRLLTSFKSYKGCSAKNLETALIVMISQLGTYPFNSEVINSLGIANYLMQGISVDEIVKMKEDAKKDDLLALLSEMMESPTRFGVDESNPALIHIVYYNVNSKFDTNSFNEDGYSSNYVVSLMSDPEKRIGGTVIDFDQLFGESSQSPIDNKSNGFAAMSQHNYEPQAAIRDNMNLVDAMAEREAENRDLQKQLAELQQRFKEGISDNSKSKKQMAKNLMEINELHYQQSLLPDDSSSNFDRYSSDTRYMDQGTVLTVRQDSKETGQISKIQPLSVRKDLVVGFQKTNEMIKEEISVNQSMRPINGLAAPFKDSRLNFLCHFNSAIEELRMEEPNISMLKIFSIIQEFKAETPSQELVYQMITKTFDLKRGVTIANPFGLPFVQIPMHISEVTLVKIYDMTQAELRLKWFESMKNMRVPSFHSEYYKMNDLRITKTKTKSKQSRYSDESESRRRKGEWSRSSGKTGSILSFR